MRVIKTVTLVGILMGSLLAAGCDQHGKTNAAPRRAAPEVGIVTVQPRPLGLTTNLPGRTSAYQVAEIRPQVSGIIQKQLFPEGSDVRTGQPLYQLDPAPFRVALDSAEASLGKARANLPPARLRAERYQKLLAEHAVSRQDSEQAVAALEQAKAEIDYWKAAVAAARINLDYTRITAPFSGRIGKSNVRTGTLVTAYQPASLAELQQLDPIYVDVVQSSAELLRMRRNLENGRLSRNSVDGRKVRIVLEDGTAYPLQGTLRFADAKVDPTTGSFTVRIEVPNPDRLLLPGMFVRAVVQEGTIAQAVVVPQQGVSRNPKGEPVALVVDETGKVQQRLLSLDRAIGNQWLVTAGLAAGERLIVEGMSKVRPGASVTVTSLDNQNLTQ